jgi:hypothetical protein
LLEARGQIYGKIAECVRVFLCNRIVKATILASIPRWTQGFMFLRKALAKQLFLFVSSAAKLQPFATYFFAAYFVIAF